MPSSSHLLLTPELQIPRCDKTKFQNAQQIFFQFDGCADTCGEEPRAESAAQAQPVVVTTPGYSYDEPEVTFPVRPVTQAPTRAPTTPLALYGAPARTGRRLNNRRNRKQGRRVKNKRRVVFV